MDENYMHFKNNQAGVPTKGKTAPSDLQKNKMNKPWFYFLFYPHITVQYNQKLDYRGKGLLIYHISTDK